jgi:hypothetical protein
MKTVFRIALYSSYSFFTTAYAQEHSVAALRAERVSEVSRLLNDFKVTSSQDAKRITPEFREAHVAHIKTLVQQQILEDLALDAKNMSVIKEHLHDLQPNPSTEPDMWGNEIRITYLDEERYYRIRIPPFRRTDRLLLDGSGVSEISSELGPN